MKVKADKLLGYLHPAFYYLVHIPYEIFLGSWKLFAVKSFSLHLCLLHYEGLLTKVNVRLVPVCIIKISEIKAFIFKVGWQFTIGKKFFYFLIGHGFNAVTKGFGLDCRCFLFVSFWKGRLAHLKMSVLFLKIRGSVMARI